MPENQIPPSGDTNPPESNPPAPAPDQRPAQPVPTNPPTPTFSPEGYSVSTLENGEQEIRLETGQVYRGKPENLIHELAKAQYHGSKRIAELSPQQQPPKPQIDPAAEALADLTAQGLGYQNAQEYREALQGMQQFQVQAQHQQVAQQFLARNPDFPQDPTGRNAQLVEQVMTQAGMAPTVDNIQMAHNHIKAMGWYTPVTPQAPVAQALKNNMPMPPNGQNDQFSVKDPNTMPLEELAAQIEYLRSQQRVN